MNKGLLFLGLILALASIGGMVFLGNILNPAPTMVAVVMQDVEPGTALSEIPDASLQQAELRGDAHLIGTYLTVADFQAMEAAGGILVQSISAGEAIPFAAVAAPDNPAGRQYSALLLQDPNLVAITIDARGIAPKGIRSGDSVDVAVAVENIQDPAAQAAMYNQQMPVLDSPLSPVGEHETVINGTVVPYVPSYSGAQGTPTVTPTPTKPPYIVPVSKIIVHNAYVLSVTREQQDAGNGQVTYGEVTSIVLVIPRDAIEYVTMADTAGALRLALLSPMAAKQDGPTMGASLQDFLDKFYADRATLMPPTATPAP